MTLSTPIKIVALAGLALMLGLGGVMMLFAHHSSGSVVVVPPVHVAKPAPAAVKHTVVHRAHPVRPRPKALPFRPAPGTPLVVVRALLHRSAAVVVIYSSKTPSDRAFFAAARQGAHMAHAAFVAADVSHNAIATAVATWSNSAAVPLVAIARRPGTVVFAATGTTDATTVAQAATSSR